MLESKREAIALRHATPEKKQFWQYPANLTSCPGTFLGCLLIPVPCLISTTLAFKGEASWENKPEQSQKRSHWLPILSL